MTEAERYTITSNDYADLLVEYGDDIDILSSYPNSTVNYINELFAVVHLPVENITQGSISIFGYYSIPSCLGLETSTETLPYLINSSPTSFSVDLNLKGNGVLVGFLDTGIDYRNPVFQNNDGTTRIVSIWDQTIDSASAFPKDFYYGTEFLMDTINEALRNPNPLSIVPSQDTIGHGTMLAGLCAGTPNEAYDFSGIATEAEFVVVKLKEAKPYLREFFEIPQTAVCYQENDVIMAVKYLDNMATRLGRPLVICVGLGTSQSDHTGNRIITRFLSTIASNYGRGIITSAGNEGNRGTHYYGDISPPATYDDVVLNVDSQEPGFTLQFWGTSPNRFWIDIFTPAGEFLSRVPPISGQTIILSYYDSNIIIDSQIKGPVTNEQFIIMRFNNPPPGQWHFYVYGAAGDLPMQFHFWLPIHNFISKNTVFNEPNNYTTITAPGNSTYIITATAYNPSNLTLYYYDSKGFTVANYPKPDITAPGVNLLCPFLDNSFANGTGTSLSASYTAGIVATLLEWGVVDKNLPQMNNLLLKKVITQSAVRKPTLEYPNADWGYGIIDVKRMEKSLNEILAK
ncbi:MAG: hypothetical protein K0S61_3253 [Anaerocolumna sp.]|jgi:hypothetical protein|nr:hypothetical protein [Anaerocolumna sp.]